MTKAALMLLFASATNTYHLPKDLLSSVCFVESSYNIYAVHKDDGKESSIGICQLHPSTARWLGYKGTDSQLLIPSANIKYAAKYLKYQINRYRGDIFKATVAYNTGHYIDHNKSYPSKVFIRWKEKGR